MPSAFFTDNVSGDKTYLESFTETDKSFVPSSTPNLSSPAETLVISFNHNFKLMNKEMENLSKITDSCKLTMPLLLAWMRNGLRILAMALLLAFKLRMV